MDSETLVLSLGSQAAAALIVMTAIRCGLPISVKAEAVARPDLERSASGQLWGDMKQRWLPTNGHKG